MSCWQYIGDSDVDDPSIAEDEDARKRLAELDQGIPKQTRQKVDSPTEEVKIKRTATHLISGH